MRRVSFWLIGLGVFCSALGWWGLQPTNAAINDSLETSVSSSLHPNYNLASAATRQQGSGECAIYAVDLIGAWVDGGAMDGRFPFISLNNEACVADFTTDVLPLF